MHSPAKTLDKHIDNIQHVVENTWLSWMLWILDLVLE